MRLSTETLGCCVTISSNRVPWLFHYCTRPIPFPLTTDDRWFRVTEHKPTLTNTTLLGQSLNSTTEPPNSSATELRIHGNDGPLEQPNAAAAKRRRDDNSKLYHPPNQWSGGTTRRSYDGFYLLTYLCDPCILTANPSQVCWTVLRVPRMINGRIHQSRTFYAEKIVTCTMYFNGSPSRSVLNAIVPFRLQGHEHKTFCGKLFVQHRNCRLLTDTLKLFYFIVLLNTCHSGPCSLFILTEVTYIEHHFYCITLCGISVGECGNTIVHACIRVRVCVCPCLHVTNTARGVVAAPLVAESSFLACLKWRRPDTVWPTHTRPDDIRVLLTVGNELSPSRNLFVWLKIGLSVEMVIVKNGDTAASMLTPVMVRRVPPLATINITISNTSYESALPHCDLAFDGFIATRWTPISQIHAIRSPGNHFPVVFELFNVENMKWKHKILCEYK